MRKIYLFLLALCVSGVSSIATAQKFPVNVSLDEKVTDRPILGVTLQPQKSGTVYGDLQTIVVNEGITGDNMDNYKVYNDVTERDPFVVKAGQTVLPGFSLITKWDGAWMHGYVYVDENQNGSLTTSSPNELLSTSYVNSRPLKSSLMIKNQQISYQFTLLYLQVLVPLWLKTCRLL